MSAGDESDGDERWGRGERRRAERSSGGEGPDGGPAVGQPHDGLAKHTFGQPVALAGELRSVLPADVVACLDFDRLTIQPGSFIDHELKASHTDILAKIPTGGGSGVFVYTVFEHQSTPDPRMTHRMYRYIGRVWDAIEAAEGPHIKGVPIVVPLVLHHGAQGWTAANSLHEFTLGLDRWPSLEPYVPNLGLLVDDLARFSDDELLARPLAPVAKLTILALRHGRQPDALVTAMIRVGDEFKALARNDAAALLRYNVNALGAASFREFIDQLNDHYPSLEDDMSTYADEAMEMFRQEFGPQFRQEGVEEGLERGLEQGDLRTLRSTLAKLMAARFGSLDPARAAEIDEADEEHLNLWFERALTAEQPDDVFA